MEVVVVAAVDLVLVNVDHQENEKSQPLIHHDVVWEQYKHL
jgi:hypothetical protein